jgi:hypothetical protein
MNPGNKVEVEVEVKTAPKLPADLSGYSGTNDVCNFDHTDLAKNTVLSQTHLFIFHLMNSINV